LKIKIIACGKLKEKYYQDACAEYVKRLSAFCGVEIIETSEYSQYDTAREIEEEGKEILAKISSGAVIVLDSRGYNPSSEEFARKLSDMTMRDSVINFIIGGPNGLSDEVCRSAGYTLSFGMLTYPHRLARVMLLEQIYRAFMINAGRSYHK